MFKKIILMTALLLLLLPIAIATNFRIISTDYAKTIQPCKPVSFRFSIQNIGAYTETYYLVADKFSEYTSFSQNPVKLDPSASQELFAFINPNCDTTGSYMFNIIVRALNTNEEVMLPIQLNIIENYDYDILFGEYYTENQPIQPSNGYYKICEGDKKHVPITIQNKADVQNSYGISLKGANFASLTQNSAALNGLQSGVIFINLEPKVGDEGSYVLTTYISPQRGNVKSGTVRLDVEECYSVEAAVPREITIANCEQSSLSFDIINKGKNDGSFNLYLDAPEWVSLDYNAREIDAGSSAAATLNFDVPCDEKGTERLDITAGLAGYENIKDSKILSLDIIPQHKFYYAVIEAPKQSNIRYDAKELQIKITNNGFKEADYSLSLKAPSWVDIEPKTLTLKPRETSNPKLVFDMNEDVKENDYAVTINAAAGGASYSKKIVLRVREEFFSGKVSSFFVKISERISYYLYYLIAGVILLGALICINILSKKGKKRSKRFKLIIKFTYTIVGAITILGGIVFSLIFFLTYILYAIVGLIMLGVILWALIKYEKKKFSSPEESKKKTKEKKGKKKKKK